MFKFSKKQVIEALPPVLQRIAANASYTEQACQLLWELGRDDGRRLNQHPDHAIRILADLASYARGKPVFYNEKVLKTAEVWLNDPDLPTYKNSPLDVVDALLAKRAEYHELEGHAVRFGFLRINLPAVEAVRKQAIAYVAKCLNHRHPRIAARAIESVRVVVDHAASMGGTIVSQEENEAWKPEQLEGVRLLNKLISETRNPVLCAYAIHEFTWYAKNGQPPEVAKGIAEALSAIAPSLELDLSIALTNTLFDIGRGEHDFPTHQQKFLGKVASDLLKTYPGQHGIEKIETVLPR